MITLRGKLTRSLVQVKPATLPTLRSNLIATETVEPTAIAAASEQDAPPTTSGETNKEALVEEWLWRGVWAFGSLPEDDVDVLAGTKHAGTEAAAAASSEGHETTNDTGEKIDSGGASANSNSCDISQVADDAKTESDTAEKLASDGESKPVATTTAQSHVRDVGARNSR